MKCLICERIRLIKDGKNPYFVSALSTGYVVLGDYQNLRGYTLFLSKEHVHELHEHPHKEKFLMEMSLVAEAVFHAFKPDKLNYEMLGNGEPHAHWHIFPRYKNDAIAGQPVWRMPKENRVPASAQEIAELRLLLLKKLAPLRKG